MPEGIRITADELKGRMQAGEDFVLIDVRNPQAWAESDVKARHAMRIPIADLDRYLPRIPKGKPIITYCT